MVPQPGELERTIRGEAPKSKASASKPATRGASVLYGRARCASGLYQHVSAADRERRAVAVLGEVSAARAVARRVTVATRLATVRDAACPISTG